ncbi:hypothetical protein HispidOSU_018584, partial [Sigmodon hispidus]
MGTGVRTTLCHAAQLLSSAWWQLLWGPRFRSPSRAATRAPTPGPLRGPSISSAPPQGSSRSTPRVLQGHLQHLDQSV